MIEVFFENGVYHTPPVGMVDKISPVGCRVNENIMCKFRPKKNCKTIVNFLLYTFNKTFLGFT
jgi:hypothetical protein